jgi:hypothetical protein
MVELELEDITEVVPVVVYAVTEVVAVVVEDITEGAADRR